MHDSNPVTAGYVLLVEDNRVNQLVAKAMVENLGYFVDTVADGEQAVQAATRTHYVAILMDCQIPGLDGYDATREIRRREDGGREDGGRRTPIIAVTASVTHANQQRCRAAGMDDYLAKPLALPDLAAALTRWAKPNRTGPTSVVTADVVAVPRSDRPVLDEAVVARLTRLGETAGEDLMGQLAELFGASADQRLLELRDGLAGKDQVAVAAAAHNLRGASANIGATDLARLATMLETHAAGDLRRGDAVLDAIEAELDRVRTALEAFAAPPIEAS